ncbi:MAG TPA: MIP/aquaporin family protein [Thermoanaerobaculia bacterium]
MPPIARSESRGQTVPGSESAPRLGRRAAVEGLGTSLLLAAVVGSGIMAERLSGGNAGLALLANSMATGAGLVALILAFGSFSGAHFNPLVTLTDAILRGRPWREVAPYVTAQLAGAFVGVAMADVMFGEPLFAVSQKARSGVPQAFGEFVATFGLLAVLFVPLRRGLAEVAVAVGAFIAAAYWFTSSTSFANPAVTLARSMSNTFTGIRPQDVPGFFIGQALGTAAFVLLARWLFPKSSITVTRSNNG